MEFCEFCIVAPYEDFCQCKVDSYLCPFVYRCQTEMRWKPLDGMKSCVNNRINLPLAKDEYRVKFELKGNLFIEIGDFVKEIKNPFDYVPQKVTLVWVNKIPYIKGFEPKPKRKTKELDK